MDLLLQFPMLQDLFALPCPFVLLLLLLLDGDDFFEADLLLLLLDGDDSFGADDFFLDAKTSFFSEGGAVERAFAVLECKILPDFVESCDSVKCRRHIPSHLL